MYQDMKENSSPLYQTNTRIFIKKHKSENRPPYLCIFIHVFVIVLFLFIYSFLFVKWDSCSLPSYEFLQNR